MKNQKEQPTPETRLERLLCRLRVEINAGDMKAAERSEKRMKAIVCANQVTVDTIFSVTKRIREIKYKTAIKARGVFCKVCAVEMDKTTTPVSPEGIVEIVGKTEKGGWWAKLPFGYTAVIEQAENEGESEPKTVDVILLSGAHCTVKSLTVKSPTK